MTIRGRPSSPPFAASSDRAGVWARCLHRIESETGLVLELDPGLTMGIERRRADLGLELDEYVEVLENDPSGEVGHLAGALTVGETYFLRHLEQLDAFVTCARQRARRHRSLSVASIACASGEEPYTLAMLLEEIGDELDLDYRILAVDLDEERLAVARRGIYRERSLRRVSAVRRDRFFVETDGGLAISDSLRARVDFEVLNLASPTAGAVLGRRGPFDLIFCRNVLIYFRPAIQDGLIETLAGVLAPGGSLFLGHAESVRGPDPVLVPVSIGDAFCYRFPVDESVPPTDPPPGNRSPVRPVSRPSRSPAPVGDPRQRIEADPLDVDAYRLLWPALLEAGEEFEAQRILASLLFLEPEDLLARFELAESLGRTGPAERSAREYRAFLVRASGLRRGRLLATGQPLLGDLLDRARSALSILEPESTP